MSRATPWNVTIDLQRVRRNAAEIVGRVGVEVYAVVKADAYGLGAKAVSRAIDDVVQGFCVFNLAEGRQLRRWGIADKSILCLGPPGNASARQFINAQVTPAVSSVSEARRLRAAGPALCVDCGMQRFACAPEDVAAALEAGRCQQAFTHAVRPEQAAQLVKYAGGWPAPGLKLHAAASNLLDDAVCRLDAVRPGLALYRGAVRITTPLLEVRDGRGPAGYGGFQTPRHAVILGGYRHGLRPGPCLLNGRRSRVIEVGMQSAFVQATPGDKAGDEVALIGDGLEAEEIAAVWQASAQEVLVSLLRPAR